MKERKTIFISYSHHDKEWLLKLRTFLKPLERSTKIDIWDDTRIAPGAFWHSEIETALSAAQIAVLLVSPNFLASDFITEQELPRIFRNAAGQGLVIIWIPVSFCMYQETELVNFQAASNPVKPLDSMPAYEQNQVLVQICNQIKTATDPTSTKPGNSGAEPPQYPEIAPDDWDSNPKSLFGRLKKKYL